MTDELFTKPPAKFADPQLRSWDERLSRPGTTAQLEVDWPPIVFGQTFPEMAIHFFESDQIIPPEFVPWDDELNSLLIDRSIRALAPDQEAIRFSLALRTMFQRAERGVGIGYFDSVFFAVLKENGLAEQASLNPLVHDLDYIQNIEKNPPSERYGRCFELIQAAIQAKAHELRTNLNYSLDEAKEILVAALVDYIDRRFSVSFRRQRGLS